MDIHYKQTKNDITNKYENMIKKINKISEQKNKLEYEFKLLKEKIDEYETNYIIYLEEFNKIKLFYNED